MTVTVYMNGNWYWFESVEKLEEVLDQNCDDAGIDNSKTMIIELD